VSISDLGSNAAFATGTGNLSDCFTLSATTQTVDVRFAVNVSGLLQAFTNALGLVASSETTFSLQVDGNQVLFDDRTLSIGPNDSQSQSFSKQLTSTIALDPSVQHCMVMEADSESAAQTQVNEPASGALLLAGLVALALLRRQSSAQRAKQLTP